MTVIHAAWLTASDRLTLWAEDGNRPGVVPTRPTGQGRPARRAKPHPFALGADDLRLAVAEIGGMEAADLLGEEHVQLTLELPRSGAGPIAAPVDDEALGGARAGTVPPTSAEDVSLWTAPGYALEPGAAAQLLRLLVPAQGSDQLFTDAAPNPVALGADVRFAALAVAMAVEFLARGRLLPDLEFAADHWRARWRPLVDGRDRSRIQALVWALPASFAAVRRAVPETDDHSLLGAPEPSGEVLRSLVWAVTDALARELGEKGRVTAPRRGTGGVAEAWVSALSSPDGAMQGCTEDECVELAGRLLAWQATRSAAFEAVRTCFRIVPPSEGGEERPLDAEGEPPGREWPKKDDAPDPDQSWRVKFALQAVDDPSLVVSAEDVWSDGPELTAIGRHVQHPDEHLLRGLGQAARLVPALGHALASPSPCDYSHRRGGNPDVPPRRCAPPGRSRVRGARPAVVALLEEEARPAPQGAEQPERREFLRGHRPRGPL